MAKGILEFNLDEPADKLAFKRANNSTDAYLVLFAIANDLFRPARKHGYNSPSIPEMDIQNWDDKTYAVVSELESMFYQILERYGVDLNDLE